MSTVAERAAEGFSTLGEKSLHAELKAWYARPGDRFETPVDGYVVDIVRDDLLIEVQTGGLSPLNRKVRALAAGHGVRVVVPIPREKWIVRVADDGVTVLGRRKSPRRGQVVDIFEDLVHCTGLIAEANVEFEVLLTREDEVRKKSGGRRGWRRRGWITVERRLLAVVGRHRFRGLPDFAALLPPALGDSFGTAEIAEAMACPRRLAQKVAYCLRETGALETVGKLGNALLYRRRQACVSGSIAP